MSVSHNLVINTDLKEFPQELLDKAKELTEKYSNLVKKSLFDKEHIGVRFPVDRPAQFYITTNLNHSMMNIKDVALFTFAKYHDNAYNELFCKLALLCKYYLKNNLKLSSDGFYQGADCSWIRAQKYVMEELNLDIKIIDNEGDNEYSNILINGELSANRFDEDNSICQIEWHLVTPENDN